MEHFDRIAAQDQNRPLIDALQRHFKWARRGAIGPSLPLRATSITSLVQSFYKDCRTFPEAGLIPGSMHAMMDIDQDKADQAVLALLYLGRQLPQQRKNTPLPKHRRTSDCPRHTPQRSLAS
jgi:hypothetical protein